MNSKKGIKTREKIYQFIVDYISKNGYAPTIKEICNGVNLKSTSSGHDYLVQLELEGKIKIRPCSPRAIKVMDYEYKKVEQ